MEDWQRNVIVSNLPKLIKLTKCTEELLTELLAMEILSDEDYQMISTEKIDLKKSAVLYGIIQTRTNGYVQIVKVLQTYRQTGAFDLLCSGFLQQDPRTIIVPALANSAHKAIIAQIDNETLRGVVERNKKEYLETFMLNIYDRTDLRLFTNSIPKQTSYYVPRLLSNRVLLSPKIFAENCSDVFVFKNIKHYELTQLANGQTTATSGSQTEKLTSRFILWEDDSDFEDICKLAKQQHNKTPVHLIVREECDNYDHDNLYIVEHSKGESDIFWDFALTQNHKTRCFLSEEEFLENIDGDNAESRGFVICDSPGMGKSWMLASLARKMTERYPENITLFFTLANFDFGNPESSSPLNILLNKIFSNTIFKEVLSTGLLKGNLKLNLFLDGFDEVDSRYSDNILDFIRSILYTTTNTLVFLTSRPHLRRQLERELDAVAYDIRPFDRENQLSFFKSYWLFKLSENCKFKSPSLNSNRLQEFAEECQKKIQVSLTQEEKDIMGVPLHCFMFAEVNFPKVEKYLSRPSATLDVLLDTVSNVGNMYKEFFGTRFSDEDGQVNKSVKSYHVWRALWSFSMDLAGLYQETTNVNTWLVEEEFLKLGVLEVCFEVENQRKTLFVHQTFAEYLVSELFCELCFDIYGHPNFKPLKTNLVDFFLNDVYKFSQHIEHKLKFGMDYLPSNWKDFKCKIYPYFSIRTPSNTAIPFFINSNLANHISGKLDLDVSQILAGQLYPYHLLEILMYSISAHHFNVFRFFKAFLLLPEIKHELDKLFKPFFSSNIFLPSSFEVKSLFPVPCSVILMSAIVASKASELLSECEALFSIAFGEDVFQTIEKLQIWTKNPLPRSTKFDQICA